MTEEDRRALEERLEQRRYILQLREAGKVEPGIRPGMDYDNFMTFIKGVKTLDQLIAKIDEYDPYYYKVLYAYDYAMMYRGIRIKIQFYKGRETIIVPKEKLESLDIQRTILKRILHRFGFTRIKRRRNDGIASAAEADE